MTPREARRAGGVGPKPAPVVSAPPRGGPNRLGRSPSAAVVARDRRDTRRAVAPAQNAHGHRRDETPPAARPGGLDDFAPPRGTHRAGRDGVDGERSPLLRWLENYLRAVVRAQRASPHPLNLPVPVATRSYGRRVFACASSSSMRTSKSLGSSHSSAFSRRCRAMSTARMIKLARARTSDVAYPNTCFHLHESLSNPWARTVGLSRADSDNGSVASKRSKSLASGLSYSELGLEAPPPRSSRKDRSTYLWPRPPVRTQSGLGASGAAS